MDARIRIVVEKELQNPITVYVSRNMPVSVLYDYLKVPETFKLAYSGQILNKTFSFEYYRMEDRSRIIFINTTDKKDRIKPYKKEALRDIVRERARMLDIAQLMIDSDPKKFRKFSKLYQQRFVKAERKSDIKLYTYDSPISPSCTPLPVVWN